MSARVRLGAVGYLNARPLVYGLDLAPRFTVRYDMPSECSRLLHDGAITRDSAREVYVESVETGRTPAEIVAEHGYAQVSDESELRVLAEAVIDANPKAAADYRNGKKQAMQALMADLRKRAPHANPKVANELLLKLLA